MDDLKRFKKHKSGSKPASVDGLLSAGGRPLKPGSKPFAKHRTYQPNRPRLDDFRRADGFHPTGRASMGTNTLDSFSRQPARDKDGQIDIGKAKPVKKAKHKKRKIFAGRRMAMKAMSMLFIVGLVSAGYIFGKALLNAQQTFSGGAAAIEENIQRDGRINILLLGRGGDGHTAPDLTDTLILASIDPINNEAALLSIPRDLYVKSGPYGGYTKINAVYANSKNQALQEGSSSERAQQAGLQAIQQEVSEFTGAPVHYYVMVDFKGFEKAIDVVGGVDANVPEELEVFETMSINGRTYRLSVPSGQQHFDGFRALAFSRSRMTSTRGDFTRTERQRLMLLALKDKVLSVGTFANPIKVTQLMNTLGNHVRTNLSGLDELARLYEIGQHITSDKVESIGLADPPNQLVTTNNIGGLSVVVPTAGLDNYDKIHEFLGLKLRDGYLKQEDAKVIVLNGTTTAGLATKTSTDLKSAGYNVTKIDDAADKTYVDTVIVNISNRGVEKTAEYLEKRFNLKITKNMPDSTIIPEGTDFVIIVGLDEKNRLIN